MAASEQIRIRPLHDGETGPLDTVYAGMSDDSLRTRSDGPRPRSAGGRPRELPPVDGSGQLVLVAEAADGGRVETVGVGLLVVTGDDVVAAAFAVVERWHRRGVGRRLLRALRHRAMDLECRLVVARVPVENRAAVGLLFSVFPDATMRRDGAVYQVVAALPEAVGRAALPLAV